MVIATGYDNTNFFIMSPFGNSNKKYKILFTVK